MLTDLLRWHFIEVRVLNQAHELCLAAATFRADPLSSIHCRWSDVAAPVLANEARNIENQFIDIAARVSSMALEVSGVAKGAGTPDAAMASQVLAGVLAAAGLQGKGRGAP